MRRALKKSECVLLGLLGLVAAFPLATGSSFSMESLLGAVTTPHRALQMREDARELQREHAHVVEVCMERAAKDETVVCPDINDPKAIRAFLKNYRVQETATGSTVTEDDGTEVLNESDLNERQRGWLRRYQRVQRCPINLNEILPGLYELCVKSLRSGERSKIRGILNDRANFQKNREQEAPTLLDIVEMLKGGKQSAE